MWDELGALATTLEQQMREVGITELSGSEDEMLPLNVGGSLVNISRSAFALEGSGYLGCLFDSVWDERLPRDADGCIVLDQSPVCTKYVIHILAKASNPASAGAMLALGDGLAEDEKAFLPDVIRALGLEGLLPMSTVLERDEFGPMTATVLGWCPGKPSGLELVYRASRDGWAPRNFHAHCGGDSPLTVTLYRVSGH